MNTPPESRGKRPSALVLMLSLALCGTPTFAQGPGGPGDGHPHRPAPPLIVALDADRDGVISAAEIAGAAAALQTLDKNGDGQLSQDELRPKPPVADGARERGGEDRGGRRERAFREREERGFGGPRERAFGRRGDNQRDERGEQGDRGERRERGDRGERREDLRAPQDQGPRQVPPAQGHDQPAAGQPPRSEPPAGAHRGGHPKPPILGALDADGDGVISAVEINNAAAALKSLDKNGDGQLTHDELHPPRPPSGIEGHGPKGSDRDSQNGEGRPSRI